MTKAEILNRIDDVLALYANTSKKVFEINQLPSVNADATAISSALLLISGVISDTMNTLSLILCEMLPEETPETAPEKAPENHPRGHHCSVCEQNDPGCKCLTCSRDNFDVKDGKPDCCRTHPHKGCCVDECPDYVKEDHDASV